MQCPVCQQDNASGARFCKRCGQPLSAAPPAEAPSAFPPPAPPAMPSNTLPYAPGPAPSGTAPPDSQQGTPWGTPSPWNAPVAPYTGPMSSIMRVSRISALSALKVAAAIYGLLYAVFGCLFLLLPAVLGGDLLDRVANDLGLGGIGGSGIVAVLVAYVAGVIIASLVAGVLAAIGALIYNLAARLTGGIEVEVG